MQTHVQASQSFIKGIVVNLKEAKYPSKNLRSDMTVSLDLNRNLSRTQFDLIVKKWREVQETFN